MTRNATEFQNMCPQPSMDVNSPLQGLSDTSEDCLFINVFVPGQNTENLAVMVWIHGGAYVVGTAGTSSYDGSVLATEEGVIVVTFNYRLGALGFLSTGSEGDLKGNYGMQDQVQALEWVKNNIKRFGGNPNNVTIFGESAGGMSVSLLMLSPLAKGLFKNVILQSGAAPALYTVLLDKEPNEKAERFANALGCPTLSDLKNCATKKNISEIITAQLKVNSTMLLAPFAPVVDGKFFESKGSYEDQGSVMIGVTRDEGSLGVLYIPGVLDAIPGIDKGLNHSDFVEKVNTTTWVRGQNEEVLKSIFQEYTNWANTDDKEANRQGYVDAFADALFKAPAISSAQIFSKKGMKTYFYQIEYGSDVGADGIPIPEWRRAYHGADVPYVFGHPLLNVSKLRNKNDTDVKFSRTIMGYWAAFAKTGMPDPSSGQNAVKWPLYTMANQQYLSLKPTPEAKSNLLAAKMNFWNSYLGTLKSEEKKPCPKDLTQELDEKVINISRWFKMYILRFQALSLVFGLICLLCVMLQASGAVAVIPTPIVNTTAGPIVGKNETLATGKSVLKYLGIPYAKAARFEDPTDPDSWNMTRNATEFGKRCPQPSLNISAPLSYLPEMSEECLFINIFAPGKKTENSSMGLSVMVWVHGGAYVFGTAGSAMYDGSVLASEEDVIVVTFNYRLGALGLLSTGRDRNLKGNYGMLDQVFALRWVNNNMRSFGGDPSKITIFGESAGGMSVSLLMLSPLAKGLYKNVILQSGAAPALYTALLDNEPKERAKMFADALGCPELSDLKNCATKKNISEIITAQLKVNSTMLLAPFAPVVDGNFLKESPIDILQNGTFSYHKEGSVMIGVMRDEGTRATGYLPGVQVAIPNINEGLQYSEFVRRVKSINWVRDQNEEISKSIIQQYTNWPNTSDLNANRQGFLDANADAAYKAPAILSAKVFDKKGIRTFFYQFDYSTDENKTIPEWRRVFHGADIKYVFGDPLLKHPNELNNTDVQFSKSVMKYWATFAKTGNPNPSSGQNAVQWPLYTTANQQYLSLKPTPEAKSNLLAARMNFWNSYLGTLKFEEKKPCPEDLSQELDEKEKYVLGLAIAVGVLGLLAIILIIVIICMKRKSKSVNIS
ncbi:uncharacterized protein LOC116305864 [Actinia tenebrosa]|uniref:Uncharacterized protein LOC116305864 n=1 Tax=Actinia tenebrosa TaxID=6105 RepID=A0A6P8J0K9_ACTTE|nr:uncharacterized protein LOC116305864 [Actinia tenebrosa]